MKRINLNSLLGPAKLFASLIKNLSPPPALLFLFYNKIKIRGGRVDDLEVLKFIKSELSFLASKEVGYITISKKYKTATYSIQSFNIIKDLIIPIFNSFPNFYFIIK